MVIIQIPNIGITKKKKFTKSISQLNQELANIEFI